MKSILDFGAKGNGVDDDTDAIQAAIDAGGAEFPNLNFKFSRTLEIRNPCRLIGCNTMLLTTEHFIQNAIVVNNVNSLLMEDFIIRATAGTLIRNIGVCSNLNFKRLRLVGSIKQGKKTSYLINLEWCANSLIDYCIGTNTQYGIRLGTGISFVEINRFTITKWLQHAILLFIGTDGIFDTTIKYLDTRYPLEGKGPRQSIVVYGDPLRPNVKCRGLKLLYNICQGMYQPWNPERPEVNLASGDQIVLHHCKNFQLIGNESYGGGENGITVTRQCSDGIITHNSCWENDAHGMQVSGQNDRCSNIIIAQNHLYNNGLRKDGKGDVMSQLYCQDADDLLIDGNLLEDRFDKRMCKNGVQLAICKSVDVLGNKYNWKDRNGFVPFIHHSSRD